MKSVLSQLRRAGASSGICPGWGAQHPVGPKKPLKSMDFTGPGGGLAPMAPPPEYASDDGSI